MNMEEILIDGDVFKLKWNEDGTGSYICWCDLSFKQNFTITSL